MEATTLIEMVSIVLGIVPPLALILIMREGNLKADLSAETKKKVRLLTLLIITGWTAATWGLTISGTYSYNTGDMLPRFLVALLVPLTLLIILFKNKTFIQVINAIPSKALAAGQFWRLLGVIFFVVAANKLGPASLNGSGVGDLLTGSIAVITFLAIVNNAKASKPLTWLLNLVGMLDLSVVLIILLTNYPIWSDAIPSTEAAGAYPLMLIVGLAAPVALALHIFSIRKLLKQ